MSDTDEIAAGRQVYIQTQFGSYGMVQWTGRNTSGMRALCDKVIVLPDQAPDVTQGGIIVPEMAQEHQGHAATTGVLVSVGPQAFAWDTHGMHRWEGQKPQAGDRVYFQKYAGQEHIGIDGLMYRIMEYRVIGAGEEIDGPGGEAENGVA